MMMDLARLDDPWFKHELADRMATVLRRSDGRYVSMKEATWRLRMLASWLQWYLEKEDL